MFFCFVCFCSFFPLSCVWKQHTCWNYATKTFAELFALRINHKSKHLFIRNKLPFTWDIVRAVFPLNILLLTNEFPQSIITKSGNYTHTHNQQRFVHVRVVYLETFAQKLQINADLKWRPTSELPLLYSSKFLTQIQIFKIFLCVRAYPLEGLQHTSNKWNGTLVLNFLAALSIWNSLVVWDKLEIKNVVVKCFNNWVRLGGIEMQLVILKIGETSV